MPNDNRFQISLYINGLQISYRHPVWKVVQRKLQDSINIVEKVTQKNSFEFSTSKTSMLNFTKISTPPPIELRLSNIRIRKSETVKYPGLVFDSKLDWKAHIQQLKSKCIKALNLMRSVSSTEWGADQKALMMIYRSLIRFKIEYGCIAYTFASSRELVSLESVSTKAKRISSGCFKTTPLSSLQVITEEPPLQIRRHKLSLKYYYKVENLLQNPAVKLITPEPDVRIFLLVL